MKALSIRFLILALLIVCSAGCGLYKTIVVPPGTPIQLRETIPNAKVFVFDESGVRRPSVAPLPAGAWVIVDDGRELPPETIFRYEKEK